MHYLLLDSNVVAGYYLPRSMKSKVAVARVSVILDAVRSGTYRAFLWIPNFCIAEVFSVFAKHAFGRWNRHVKTAGGAVSGKVYERLVHQFEGDVHQGRFMNQYELSRYHILGDHLVSPIDHYYQFSRRRNKRKSEPAPMGTFDHLLVSMGIQLAKVHGRENVTLVSADDRVTNILSRAKGSIPSKTVTKLKLRSIAERVTGRGFSPDLFPGHVNLKSATKAELVAIFGAWPLPVGVTPTDEQAYRHTK